MYIISHLSTLNIICYCATVAQYCEICLDSLLSIFMFTQLNYLAQYTNFATLLFINFPWHCMTMSKSRAQEISADTRILLISC